VKTVAILSRKGGAGKTTVALHLAVAAEALGVVTAVFDLDPQASACIWSDHRGEQFPAVVPAQAPRLNALLAQARAKSAGLVILDTAPLADSIASEAASYADAIIIPCRPSSLDLDAIGATIRLARATNVPCYVVINAAPPIGVETGEAQNGLTQAGVELAPVVLHQRKAFAAWMHEGRTAQEIDPTCKAALEIGNLTTWLCNKLNLLPKKINNKRDKSLARL
jgi:chromosome partitioning protein